MFMVTSTSITSSCSFLSLSSVTILCTFLPSFQFYMLLLHLCSRISSSFLAYLLLSLSFLPSFSSIPPSFFAYLFSFPISILSFPPFCILRLSPLIPSHLCPFVPSFSLPSPPSILPLPTQRFLFYFLFLSPSLLINSFPFIPLLNSLPCYFLFPFIRHLTLLFTSYHIPC